MSAAPLLSVVIATRDRADFLRGALTSLEAQHDGVNFEVVVADNGSSDGTAALVRDWPRARFALSYVFVPKPNRGAARNAGILASRGAVVVFVDDDVELPPGFIAAHANAHAGTFPVAVSGPIVNVDDDARPLPVAANFSNAFFCTCNVSVPRSALIAVGNFDERFELYGWEDTELGLRLRKHDVRRAFAWDAYLWHLKPEGSETLEVVLQKTTERAQMAARLLQKDAGWRAKLATGAYGANLVRAAIFAPAWLAAPYRRLATDERAHPLLRAFAKSQLLDIAYTTALRRALAAPRAIGAGA